MFGVFTLHTPNNGTESTKSVLSPMTVDDSLYAIKNCYWMSLLLKIEHIISTRALPDIYMLAHRPVALWQVHVYQARHLCLCITLAYTITS